SGSGRSQEARARWPASSVRLRPGPVRWPMCAARRAGVVEDMTVPANRSRPVQATPSGSSRALVALFRACLAYMVVGVASGLFYREFTKANDFAEGQFTQLGVVHTHLLTLGFIVLLIVLVLEKVFVLSHSPKLFTWFFWLYNAGVVLTAAMMVWHGSLTVLGRESTSMIAGIAGLGHIFLTVAMILFFIVLGGAISNTETTSNTEPAQV